MRNRSKTLFLSILFPTFFVFSAIFYYDKMLQEPLNVFIGHSRPTKVLLTIVSVGPSPERNEIIRNNINYIFNQLDSNDDSIDIDCLLCVYVKYELWPSWVKEMNNNPSNATCRILPLFKGGYQEMLKNLHPLFLANSGYDYLHLLLDDVVLYPPKGSFQLQEYLNIIKSYHLSVASTAISNTIHPVLWPVNDLKNKPGIIGRIVDMIEIQSTTYEIQAWNCEWELIDTEYKHGWGLDVWFYDYCISSGKVSGRLGIIDTQVVHHMDFPTSFSSIPEKQRLMAEQIDQWKKLRNITLRTRYPTVLSEINDTKKVVLKQ